MKFEDIRLHDCIQVQREHIDPEKSYYGSTHIGIMIGLGETNITIKTQLGVDEQINITHKDYKTSFELYSELDFRDKIKKAIDDVEKDIEDNKKRLLNIINWYKTFDEISIWGKIARIFHKGKSE